MRTAHCKNRRFAAAAVVAVVAVAVAATAASARALVAAVDRTSASALMFGDERGGSGDENACSKESRRGKRGDERSICVAFGRNTRHR